MKQKVDTIEKLAILIADGFATVDERFDKMDERFDRIESEIRSIKHLLESIDTRHSALEHVVFGTSLSEGGRLKAHSVLNRLSKREDIVYKK